jgi:hypothetical protein
MAASAAIPAAGSSLLLNTGGGFVTVAEVKDINGPGIKVGVLKATNLLSPSFAEEKKPGWIDGGTVEVQANLTPAQYATLLATLRIQYTWRVLFSNGSRWDFTGHIVAIASDLPLEDIIEMPFSIELTGLPTFTP